MLETNCNINQVSRTFDIPSCFPWPTFLSIMVSLIVGLSSCLFREGGRRRGRLSYGFNYKGDSRTDGWCVEGVTIVYILASAAVAI